MVDSMSSLICDKCGKYYELQKGETLEEFPDKCECGGKLEYFSYPEEELSDRKIPLSVWIIFILIIGIFGMLLVVLNLISPILSYITLILMISGFLMGYIISSLTYSIKKAAQWIVLILVILVAVIVMYLAGIFGSINPRSLYNLFPPILAFIGFVLGIIFQKRDEMKSFGEIKKETWQNMPNIKAEETIEEILREFRVNGLNEIIFEIKNLDESKFYKDMRKAFSKPFTKFDTGTKSLKEEVIIKEEYLKSPLQKLAFKNMRRSRHQPLISFLKFLMMYNFLESIYYMNAGSELNKEDLKNIYQSGLDERIVLRLDKFDEDETKKVTAEFFKNLILVKWNYKSEKLFKKLENALEYAKVPIFGFSNLMFDFAEKEFILFLAGCSAVNDKRDKINQNDIIRAYKTYFKLIKTDLTEYKSVNVGSSIKKNKSSGYLVCQKCNSYYKLQPGESPEDFVYECECGGALKYYDDINWLLNDETA